MTISPIFNIRRCIPRWREFSITATTGELLQENKSKNENKRNRNHFSEKLNRWKENQSISNSADVVSSAISLGYYSEAIGAAEFLLNQKDNITDALYSIALEVLIRTGRFVNKEGSSEPVIYRKQDIFNRIHFIRERIKRYPQNAILWVDLSHAYAVIGQLNQSLQAMANSIYLQPENRFVLRSATRLYIHIGEPDRAHRLLLKTQSSRIDPWLIAAEIVTASVADTVPKFYKIGKEYIEQNFYSPFNLAELNSVIATLELNTGNIKKARKLFLSSLIDPTENSVAQSVWVKSEIPTLQTDFAVQKTKRVYEAKALSALHGFQWNEIIDSTKKWFADEPYSSRPAELGSYAALIGFCDFSLSEEFTRNGLISNPGNFALLNNLAFSLANQNKVKEADDVINSIPYPYSNIYQEIVVSATKGLIEFRKGEFDFGQSLYENSITISEHIGRKDLQSMAIINLAKECYLSKKINQAETLALAEKGLKLNPSPQNLSIFKHLTDLCNSG
jgi:tetratricopeptide (TPR) repeat protein